MGIAAGIIARGGVKRTGVVMPEFAFDPEEIFRELEKRRILVHIQLNNAE